MYYEPRKIRSSYIAGIGVIVVTIGVQVEHQIQSGRHVLPVSLETVAVVPNERRTVGLSL